MAKKLIISNERADSQISQTSEELDYLEENIIVAPYSLALLGQIMLLSTQRDFSLISKPEKQPLKGAEENTNKVEKGKDFKYHITHPESFRATLVQVSNAGYHAFLAAHTNMNKIRLACDNAKQHVELITECVIEGEDSDITTMVPVSLESMLETAEDCTNWSKEICSNFHDTLKLLEEVLCSCHGAQITNQKKLDELENQKAILAFEKVEAENNEEKQKKIEEIEKKMDKERDEFLKYFQESEHNITKLKKDLITEEGELEKFKLELEEAQKNVDKEKAKKSWIKWVFRQKTDGQVVAEYEKEGKDYQVRDQERKVNTKTKMVDTDIECKKNIIDQKESMKSNGARGIGDKNTSIDKMDALSNKISEALIKISTADVKKLDIEYIKKLIKEGIENITELEANWKQLALYFNDISCVIEVAMGRVIKDFVKLAGGKLAEGNSNSLKTLTKKNLIKLAFNAYSRCTAVSIVSKCYLEISKTHLMPSIIQLGTLLAIDAEREPEKIKSKTEEIQNRSQKTIDFVKDVVIKAKLENEKEVKLKAIEFK